MSVIYLDFDGVLHPHDVHVESDGRIHLGALAHGHSLFEHAHLLENVLFEFPSVRVVLSSSWVPSRGLDEAVRYLPLGLRQRVVGATFDPGTMLHQAWSEVARGYQVLADVMLRRPRQWLALDDDTKDWPADILENLVKTDPILGLSRPGAVDELRTHLLAWERHHD